MYKLLEELCSEGVQYKTIGELLKEKNISIITPSFKIKKKDYKNIGKSPIVSQEQEYISGYSDLIDKNIPIDNYVCFGDHSEHIKFINFSFVQGADGLKIMKIVDRNINTKYIFYIISNNYKRHNSYERHFKYLCETLIPLPPLEVQNEIVRILDKYTEVSEKIEAELLAEIKSRKKQYEFYRNKLLTFKEVKVDE